MTVDNWVYFLEEFAKLNDYQLPKELPAWLKGKKLEQYKEICEKYFMKDVLDYYFG